MEKIEEEINKIEVKKPEENYLVMQGDPEKQLEFGRKCASALMAVVSNKAKKVMIKGEQYLEFEDWQTLARFFGITVGTEWTKEVMREGKLIGYEAKAKVVRQGEYISSAEAMCLRSEKNWADRDEFALRSMAQTRACAKALRNVLAWVAVLAGFRGTPAEEMTGEDIKYEPVEDKPVRKREKSNVVIVCSNCESVISEKVRDFSLNRFHKVLCIDCQKSVANNKL